MNPGDILPLYYSAILTATFLPGCSLAHVDCDTTIMSTNVSGIRNRFPRDTEKGNGRNSFQPPFNGLIPLANDEDFDLQHLSKFSTTEFLDKIFGQRIFNTTMNVIVPMFHVTFPQHAPSGSTFHLAMQALLGLFSFAAWAFTVILPSLFTYIIPFGFRSMDRHNYFALNHEKFEELSNKIGLDWRTCLQKTICEAHRSPKYYGIVASPFKIFFPPPSAAKHLESSITKGKISAYQLAAKVGSQSKTECEDKFRCFFDILDLIHYLIRWRDPLSYE